MPALSRADLAELQLGLVVFSYDRTLQTFSALAEDLLGGNLRLSMLLGEDSLPLSDAEHPVSRCTETGGLISQIVGVPGIDRIRWVRLRCQPIPGGVRCLVEDAEEHHRLHQLAIRAATKDDDIELRSRMGIWELDLETMHPRWDDEVCRIHDLPPGHTPTLQEAVGFYTPETQPIIGQLVAAAIERGEDWDRELPVVTACGRRIWVRTIGRPVDEGGRCVRLLGCFLDISERVRARQEREDILSHARAYELLCNDAHELMSILSDDGRVLQINDAGLAMLGYGRDELTGETFASLVHPEDLERSAQAALRLREQPAQRVSMTNRIRCRDGRWVWLEWTASSREGGRIYAVARDVTELREQQENLQRLALIANQTHNAILITDRQGQISWANRAFEQLCGHGVAAAIGRRPGELLQGPETDPETVLHMREQLVRGEGFDVEIVNYRCDGTTYWAALEVQPILGEDGQTTGFMGIQNNITEQKRAEQALVEARNTAQRHAAEARDASTAKSDFLATMSHELRTPMNGVLGTLDLLSETLLDVEQRCFVETIQGSCDALLAILNDILDVSKIEAGCLQLTRAPFDVIALIDDISALMRPSAQRKGLRFVVEIDRSLMGWRLGDRLRLKQILLNLASNAIKFTEAGSVRLRAAADGHGIRLEVKDTGIGITTENQRRLFQPFSQVDASATRRFNGTGLGLAISRQLVELMGGAVGVESVEGQGSTFWVALPLAETAPVAPRPPLQAARPVGLEGLSVLLVEDHAINQMVATQLLRRIGCVPVLAADGVEALARLREARFDVVLMDCHMPNLDGWEATRRWRADEAAQGLSRTPIIALTANAMRGDREQCIAAGMDDYLPKPIRIDVLRDALSRARAAPAAPGAPLKMAAGGSSRDP